MVYLLALLIFVALSAACWFVSVACYRSSVAGPDPAAAPHYRTTAAAAIGVAAVTSFVTWSGWQGGGSPRSPASGCRPAGRPCCSSTWRRVPTSPGWSSAA